MSAAYTLQGWMVTGGGQNVRLVKGGGVEPVLSGQKTSRLQKEGPSYLSRPTYLPTCLPTYLPSYLPSIAQSIYFPGLDGHQYHSGQDIRLVKGGGGEPVLTGQNTSRLQKEASTYLPSLH